ncbi:MAG: peptidoglycan bridge formation glycyltransferase FemA/FemB family protein [Candidatus Moranbacteria bacterium]|nr:peptidoglycan bridge formation glycyltransferase FemA/FemB family protein [Candidatus Moranbacteria bacterium]
MNRTIQEQMKFLQEHIADGGFLQSQEWMGFQECLGRRTFHFEGEGCFANVIEHTLPWVGKYWYIPRGPVIASDKYEDIGVARFLEDISRKARQERIGWIRIEPADEAMMRVWAEVSDVGVRKTAHDVQPKEILVMPIDGDEKGILADMKPKTRYNIRLAQKKGVRVFVSREQQHIDAFCDLVEITAKRDGIVPHPRSHYQKMLQMIPDDTLKLYLAEYEGKIVAANLVVFFGTYATYLHGASGNEYREVMAPSLLQWHQIQDAKKHGCLRYDFGGVKTKGTENDWSGITRFKQGFTPRQETTHFLGSYDVLIAKNQYRLYRILQGLKRLSRNLGRIAQVRR